MTAITEEDRQRLTEYLTSQVVNGISGRDGRDLVDLVPSRSIFAGVLQPPRSSEIQAAQSGVSNRDAPAGTALGLDFRLKAETEIGAIRLRISPHWSLYYPVFPSYEEARKANELLVGSEVVGAQSG